MIQNHSQADIDALLERMKTETDAILAQMDTPEYRAEQQALLEELGRQSHATWAAFLAPPEAPTPPPASRRGRRLPHATREQIASLRRAGGTIRQIAAAVGVSINSVRKYSSAQEVQSE